jgi:hypothetical protein
MLMKASEISVGRRYFAKISGTVVTIRVLQVDEMVQPWTGRRVTKYRCLNERTNRVVLLSLMRLRGRAPA